ncbi:MAG: Rrf2 family transcriptional regulator [Planctomycetes bacterium]|nr:Rrf2 family transcriptional regulator [Planctomycetota bacterium]
MQVSKRCEYARRTLIVAGLAGAAGRKTLSTTELGAHQRIPQESLEVIFLQPSKEGLLRSGRDALPLPFSIDR